MKNGYFEENDSYLGKSSGNYLNHKKEGEWKTYWFNGNVQYIEKYHQDKLNGKYQEFHQNGKLYNEGNYLNGIKIGFWIEDSDEKFYLKNGYFEEISPEGSKAFGNYLNGKREDEWKSYRNNGKIESIKNYHEGSLDGKYQFFSENGNLFSEGNFLDDKMEGEWIYYWDNRNVQLIKNYHEGILNGKYQYFHNDGILHEGGNYLNGIKIGIWIEESDEKFYL